MNQMVCVDTGPEILDMHTHTTAVSACPTPAKTPQDGVM